MGRSVHTPRAAIEVFYLAPTWGVDQDNEAEEEAGSSYRPWEDEPEYDYWDWEDLKEMLRVDLENLSPSISYASFWHDQEGQIIAGNGLVHVGISEYCGLVSVWVVANPETPGIGLSEQWVSKVWPKFAALYTTRLSKMGSMSNGEGVYRKVVA